MDGQTTSDLVNLIERLGQGDDDARRLLLERAHQRLVRIAATIFRADFPALHQRHELESVVSEAWLRLDSSLEAVQPHTVDEFFGLVIVKIRQVLLDMARRQQRADRGGRFPAPERDGRDARGTFEPGDTTHEPGRLALLAEFHQKVTSLLGDERRVFELLYYGGLTQAEIARVIGLHPRKVCRLWFSATQHLAEWADTFRELR
jgi:RNA polymerase sigma factor (sigma-70 family)